MLWHKKEKENSENELDLKVNSISWETSKCPLLAAGTNCQLIWNAPPTHSTYSPIKGKSFRQTFFVMKLSLLAVEQGYETVNILLQNKKHWSDLLEVILKQVKLNSSYSSSNGFFPPKPMCLISVFISLYHHYYHIILMLLICNGIDANPHCVTYCLLLLTLLFTDSPQERKHFLF